MNINKCVVLFFLSAGACSAIGGELIDKAIFNCMATILGLKNSNHSSLAFRPGIPEERMGEMVSEDISSDISQRDKFMVDVVKRGDRKKLEKFLDDHMEKHQKQSTDKERLFLFEDAEEVKKALQKLQKKKGEVESRVVSNLLFSYEYTKKYWENNNRQHVGSSALQDMHVLKWYERKAECQGYIVKNINECVEAISKNGLNRSGKIEELTLDKFIFKCMEGIIKLRAINPSTLLGIPEERIKKMTTEGATSEFDQRDKFMVDVIKRGDEKELTTFLESYMKAHEEEDDRHKYILAVDQDVFYKHLQPLRISKNLDGNEKAIVDNLLFSATYTRDYCQKHKRLIETGKNTNRLLQELEDFALYKTKCGIRESMVKELDCCLEEVNACDNFSHPNNPGCTSVQQIPMAYEEVKPSAPPNPDDDSYYGTPYPASLPYPTSSGVYLMTMPEPYFPAS